MTHALSWLFRVGGRGQFSFGQSGRFESESRVDFIDIRIAMHHTDSSQMGMLAVKVRCAEGVGSSGSVAFSCLHAVRVSSCRGVGRGRRWAMRRKKGLQCPLDGPFDAFGRHLGLDAEQQRNHGFAFEQGGELEGGQQGV